MILSALDARIAGVLFFANLLIARLEGRYTGSVPLVVFGLATAAIIATYTLLSGAIAFIPAFFWSLGWQGYRQGLFEWMRWAPRQEPGFAARVVSRVLWG